MNASRRITINGRFLGRPVSGVERYGREILRAWDARLIANPSLPRPRILAPAGVTCDLPLGAIGFETGGTRRGHLWEQIDLARLARGDVLVSLANSGPLLHRRQIAVIHDAAVYRLGGNYGFRYRALHRFLGRALARTARLATVSAFSRSELAHFLGIAPDRILIAGNGSEHLASAAADQSVLQRLELAGRPFLLTVGTASRNKNLALVMEAWSLSPPGDARLAIVGPVNDRIFSNSGLESGGGGVLFTGRVSDGELTALFRHAAALVFPSRYEGFGIPPLEAMVNGCPILASGIPPVREVCGDEASYFDPDDADGLARLMAERLAQGRDTAAAARLRARASRFSWTASAAVLAGAAEELTGAGSKTT